MPGKLDDSAALAIADVLDHHLWYLGRPQTVHHQPNHARATPGGVPLERDLHEGVADGRVMVLRFVDPEVAGRYGTGVYVRCAPRA
jgi:hypothetical protein